MSTARNQLVALLAPLEEAGAHLLPYARQIDPPDRATVMVRLDEVTPAEQGLWEVSAALVLIVPAGASDAVEDELDELLEDVLLALEVGNLPNAVRWTSAKRAVYGEPEPTNPAYEVSLLVRTQKESTP